MGTHEDDVRVGERGRPDRVADGLRAPGQAHVRVEVDDFADALADVRIRLDDQNPEAGAVR